MKVVVIGGAVLDVFLFPHKKMILHDSNPGYMLKSFGGVGRNIAENLARLNVDTTLLTVLGEDTYGEDIYNDAHNIKLAINPIYIKETPQYISIIDENNEDLISVAVMDGLNELNIEHIKRRNGFISDANYIVIDTNLNYETIEYIVNTYKKKIFVDTISSQKALKIKPLLNKIHTLKTNLLEAEALSNIKYKSKEDLNKIGKYFIDEGVKEIFITLGKDGAAYITEDNIVIKEPFKTNVKNTTGAGDAFFAGVIYANINNIDPINAGFANAKLNLESENAVLKTLNKDLLEKTIKENSNE